MMTVNLVVQTAALANYMARSKSHAFAPVKKHHFVMMKICKPALVVSSEVAAACISYINIFLVFYVQYISISIDPVACC